MENPLSFAYHEAGHAVIANALGIEVLEIAMLRDGECYAHVAIALDAEAFFDADGRIPVSLHPLARKRVLALLAGEEAQLMLAGKNLSFDERSWNLGGFGDYCAASDTATGMVGEDDRREYLDKCRGEVRSLLLKHWSAVQAIASRLTPGAVLDGDEVEEIILSATQPGGANE